MNISNVNKDFPLLFNPNQTSGGIEELAKVGTEFLDAAKSLAVTETGENGETTVPSDVPPIEAPEGNTTQNTSLSEAIKKLEALLN